MIKQDLSKIYSKGFNQNEVLIYRRNHAGFLKSHSEILKNIFNIEGKVKEISEYKDADYFIDVNQYKLSDLSIEDFETIDSLIPFNEVILRDRWLRSIPFSQAAEIVYTVSKWLIEFFKKNKFKLIVSQCVDNYVMDLTFRIATNQDVTVLSYVNFFFPGYKRITLYGEHNFVREPSKNEVQKLYKQLVEKEKTVFVVDKNKALKNAVVYYFKYKLKYFFHYLIKYKLLGNKQYDYPSTPYPVYPRKLSGFFSGKYFTDTVSKKESEKVAYLPLQYFPEATLEYWVDDARKVNYNQDLLRTVRKIQSQGYTVYVKEHSAMAYKRELTFYKLLKNNDVKILNPFVSAHDIMEASDLVVVGTGTTGIESLMNGKNVVFTTKNWYNKEMNSGIHSFEICNLSSEREKLHFCSMLLQSTIKS